MHLHLPELRDCLPILYPSITITQKAECHCWLGTLYIILGFIKLDLLQPGVQSDGFPHHQKVDVTGHGKSNYHHPTHQQFRSNNFFSKFSVFAPFRANLLLNLMTFSISAFSSISKILLFFLLVAPDLNLTLFLSVNSFLQRSSDFLPHWSRGFSLHWRTCFSRNCSVGLTWHRSTGFSSKWSTILCFAIIAFRFLSFSIVPVTDVIADRGNQSDLSFPFFIYITHPIACFLSVNYFSFNNVKCFMLSSYLFVGYFHLY